MNYFSQDHCPGKVVYWPAAAIAGRADAACGPAICIWM